MDADTVKATLAKNLLRYRESRNLSQDQIAQKLGVTRVSISNYERGDRVPDAVFLARLAQSMGVTTDYLLGLSENETRENEALAERIPLEDEALNFFKGCESKKSMIQLAEISRFLGDPYAKEFFVWFFKYAQVARTEAGDEYAAMSRLWYMHKATAALEKIAKRMGREQRTDLRRKGV